MRYHADARRRFWGDIFRTAEYDINAVQLFPGVVIAWHRHQYQDDKLFALYGQVDLQAIDPEGQRHTWNMDSHTQLPVCIPRGWWHGYQSRYGATLIQLNGPRKYDGSDEERMGLDVMPWA